MRKILASLIEIAELLDEKELFGFADEIAGVIERVAKKKEEGWPEKLKEGRFTEYCKRQGFDGPCKACADKAMDSDDASVRGMASFYLNTALKKRKSK